MPKQNRVQLFDRWAETYDASVQRSAGDFPFDGYEQVLDEIVRLADPHPSMAVLDVGVGTGNLAARLAVLDCQLWGIDFSPQMLAKARANLPQATLIQADLLAVWPAELRRKFDRIVSAYVLHEFDLDTKVHLLQKLAQHHLAEGGSMIIGDIAFPTGQAREQAHQRWAERWDEDEYYWAADEAIAACQRAGLEARYAQISSCGGVFLIIPGGER